MNANILERTFARMGARMSVRDGLPRRRQPLAGPEAEKAAAHPLGWAAADSSNLSSIATVESLRDRRGPDCAWR
jgi:hypothetical protein